MPNVIVKNRSQVFGYYDHNMTVMFERIGDHLEKEINIHLVKNFGTLEPNKFF
jgi:hypothetical protein